MRANLGTFLNDDDGSLGRDLLEPYRSSEAGRSGADDDDIEFHRLAGGKFRCIHDLLRNWRNFGRFFTNLFFTNLLGLQLPGHSREPPPKALQRSNNASSTSRRRVFKRYLCGWEGPIFETLIFVRVAEIVVHHDFVRRHLAGFRFAATWCQSVSRFAGPEKALAPLPLTEPHA